MVRVGRVLDYAVSASPGSSCGCASEGLSDVCEEGRDERRKEVADYSVRALPGS